MSKLSQISIKGFLQNLYIIKKSNDDLIDAYEILLDKNFDNYQELQDAYTNGEFVDYPDKVVCVFEKELNRIKALVRSPRNKCMETYRFTALEEAGIDEATISLINKVCRGSDLAIFSLLGDGDLAVLRKLSIEEIKKSLGCLIERYDDETFLTNGINIYFAHIRPELVADIANAVRLFDSMVIEQMKACAIIKMRPPRHIDPFTINLGERMKLIEPRLERITEVLMKSTGNYMWGKLSVRQKNKIMSAVKTPDLEYGYVIRDTLLKLAAKYLTNFEVLDENAPNILAKRLQK